jgi:hypothetical protein
VAPLKSRARADDTERVTTVRRALLLLTAFLTVLLTLGGGAVAPVRPSPAQAATTLHVVRPGETVTSIAQRYGLRPVDVAVWNSLPASYRIHPDGMLRLTPPATRLPAYRASSAKVTATQLGATWRSGCPVPPSRLRVLTVTYLSFAGTAAQGRLVVHEDLVQPTALAFRQLYHQRFPVQRIVPVSSYGGSDARSMAANNTSGFNCRRTTSGTAWSEHSYGRAVDVNPVQNPYVKGTTVLPAGGTCCTDRRLYRRGMLHAGGAVPAFTAHGFHWGGTWTSLKDYQHLSTTNR